MVLLNYHLPILNGYDYGKLLSYIPLYGIRMSTKDLITECRFYKSSFHEVSQCPFSAGSDSVALAQRDCLNDPSVYLINRSILYRSLKYFIMMMPQNYFVLH